MEIKMYSPLHFNKTAIVDQSGSHIYNVTLSPILLNKQIIILKRVRGKTFIPLKGITELPGYLGCVTHRQVDR